MHIRIIKDPLTQMAAFSAGEVDFIASFCPEHVDTLKAQARNQNERIEQLAKATKGKVRVVDERMRAT